MSPSDFASSRLHITLWPKFTEILNAVEAGHRKILVRSCNGAGKTTALATLCNWKLTQFKPSIVLTTASSWTQVTRSLWGEIRQQARLAQLYKSSEMSATQIKLDEKHYGVGISPSQVENAQGFHAEHMLIAVDEATGVDREIIDALWGNATSKDAQMIMIYNPINTASFPYEAEQTGDWHLITISAFEHPNVIEGKELIPGAVTREWIEDRLKAWSYEVPEDDDPMLTLHVPWLNKYYRKTDIVAARICGEWPMESGEGFIDMSLLRHSFMTEPVPGVRSVGVDVARGGTDSTVISYFDGNTQLPFEQWTGKNLMKTANRVKQLYDDGWSCIAIDDTGMGGGVTDRLREMNVPVHAVNFARSAKGFLPYKQLANARSEMYFVLEEELRTGSIKLLDDHEQTQELTSLRLTTVSGSGAYALEEKDMLKKRLGRSPDKADATALARYGLRLERYAKRARFI
jgi:phage terminase large subunit